jgi:hypothetical protein
MSKAPVKMVTKMPAKTGLKMPMTATLAPFFLIAAALPKKVYSATLYRAFS